MERKAREFYESPSAEIVRMTQEGVVCTSPDSEPKFNKPFNEEEEW